MLPATNGVQPLKIVGFQKVNGVRGKIVNDDGVEVESYSMDYEADIEATQRCELLLPENPDAYLMTLSAEDASFPIFTNDVLNAGQHFKMGGTIVFEKTENGWRQVKANKQIYSF